MVTEDYVSFETAKLLKEKGFDEPFYFFYRTDDRMIHHVVKAKPLVYDNTIDDEVISAPTYQIAMKWLREIHKIHLVIYPYGEYSCDNYQFDVYQNNELIVSKDDGYITYEQAVEAAIKYCLENLI